MLKSIYSSFFASLLLLFLFVSCKNLKNSPEVKRIDSLKTILTEVRNKLAEVDSQKIYKTYSDHQNNSLQIKLYFNDKKENGVWENITQYDAINDPLIDFINKRGLFQSQIQQSTKQLNDLRSDFINKTINKEQFIVYYDKEAGIIEKLGNKVETSVNFIKDEMTIFDTLNPKILIIIEKLKAEKLNSPNEQ